MAWSCALEQEYWTRVLTVLQQLAEEMIDWSPLVVLLGYVKELPKQCRRLVAMGLVVAKRRLAMWWMWGPVPTLGE